MKITYDSGARALYIEVTGGKHWKTIQEDDTVFIDINTANEVMGIEIIGVDTEPKINISEKNLYT